MLSLASYEKDDGSKGNNQKGMGKNDYVSSCVQCCIHEKSSLNCSRICKLYSDYSMPKSIHTVAMRRKVNKHSIHNGNDKGLMTQNFLHFAVEVYFGFSTKMLMQYDPICRQSFALICLERINLWCSCLLVLVTLLSILLSVSGLTHTLYENEQKMSHAVFN